MEYSCGEKRRSKKDLKRKRQFRVFKRGGQQRGMEVEIKRAEK
jgi:hypothetical protein